MNPTLPLTLVPQPVATPLLRLGENHGYRIEGDAVHLRATLGELPPAACELHWALQLWACPPGTAGALPAGSHLVTEAWLPTGEDLASLGGDVELVAAATPPAGTGEWAMMLTLVAGRDDSFDELHDVAVYPRLEVFTLPQLQNGVRCVIDGRQARIEVGTIANPRDARNLSGTLSLELWALPGTYDGRRLVGGHALAGAVLGNLGGQAQWHGLSFDLPVTPPPPGTWSLVVMLREWVGSGYVTRDFANIADPLVVAKPARKAPARKTAKAGPAKPRARKQAPSSE